jgi:hypothetical protein
MSTNADGISARQSASMLAQLVLLLSLPGCAHPRLVLNPVPSGVQGVIGRVSITGVLDGGDIHLTIDRTGEPTPHNLVWSHAPSSVSAGRVISTADHYIGVPYKHGGTTPEGFDCSGFVQFVFRQQGVELPRTAREQSKAGRPAALQAASLRPGDLMFFSGNGPGIDHVALYVGDGRIIHASAGSHRVRYDDLATERGRWFLRHHVTSRRILAHRGTV